MDDYDKEMEVIALLSNPDDNYTYIECDKESVDHTCEKTNETRQLELKHIEYFKDSQVREDKANYCEFCNQVFVYKD